MSNSVFINLADTDKITVCENLECDESSTPIKLGEDATVFMDEIHLEVLFEQLDNKLHKETYSDLEDKLFTLQDDFDELLEQNVRLIEQAVGE